MPWEQFILDIRLSELAIKILIYIRTREPIQSYFLKVQRLGSIIAVIHYNLLCNLLSSVSAFSTSMNQEYCI